MSSGGFKSPVNNVKEKKIKKRRFQCTLSSFFGSSPLKKPRVVTTDVIGGGVKYKCSYCGVWKFPQGFKNHVQAHKNKGEKLEDKRENGKVKCHGKKYDKPFVGGTDVSDKVSSTQDNVVDMVTGDNEKEDVAVDDVTEDTSTSPLQKHRLSSGGKRNFTIKVNSQ